MLGRGWCIYRFKGTNFKAIHNSVNKNKQQSIGVYTGLKVRILKQFTTRLLHSVLLMMVYIPV